MTPKVEVRGWIADKWDLQNMIEEELKLQERFLKDVRHLQVELKRTWRGVYHCRIAGLYEGDLIVAQATSEEPEECFESCGFLFMSRIEEKHMHSEMLGQFFDIPTATASGSSAWGS